jgi:TonB-linked SusC/RagA family outer membrane protein
LLPVFQPGYPGRYSTIPSESIAPNNKFWYAFVPNPFSVFSYTDAKNDVTNLYASAYAEAKLPYGFSAKSQIGLYTYNGASYSWSKSAETPWDPTGANRGQAVNGIGVGNYKGYGYNWDNTMNFARKFGDHNINVTAGISAQLENNYNGSYVGQSNFINEAVPYLGYGAPSTTVVGPTSISEVTLYGVLGRLIYGYKDKYLITANVRRDQSSRFSEELRTAVFPSASIAWRVSEEKFAKSISFISDLKLRAGWGKIGNQNGIPAYPTYNLLGSGQDYSLNNVLVSGVATTGLGNKSIAWESTVSTNIGVDFTVLNKSLTFTADYYIKDNSQILLQLPIVATGGVGIYPTSVPGPAQNVGRIRNSGFELTATYTKKLGEFDFSVSGNGTWNKNEILDLGGSKYLLPPNIINQLGNFVSRFAVGHSIGEFYGFKTEGIFQNQTEVDAANAKAKVAGKDYFQEKFTAPGDYKFKDVNNDGFINNEDRTFIGNPNPSFSYGLTLNGAYKGFDFTAFFQGVANVDVFNALAYRTEASYFQPFNRTKRAFEERWTGQGTSNTYPRIIYDDPNNNTRISSRYIESGSYMRMRNIQLGYSLPKSLIAKMKIENLRFYIAGQNLLTFTRYRGLDPEMGVGQSEGNSDTNYDLGIDRGMYPQPKTVMLGLNLTF